MLIIFIFLVSVFVLLFNVKIKFIFNYSENNIKFDVYIYKFNITKFFKNYRVKTNGNERVLNNRNKGKKLDFKISLNLFLEILNKIKFLKHKPIFIINNCLEFGLDEADVTAILYGYLSNLLNVVLKFLSSYVKLKDSNINIIPKYNSIFLKFYFEGILKIRIVQIIYISFLFITLGRKLNGATSN